LLSRNKYLDWILEIFGLTAASAVRNDGGAHGTSGRPKRELVLTDDERGTLERLATRRRSAQAIALRARIVLLCATGIANREAALQLG
jgi:hypothetical protein